jgi:hypothetical protein
MAERDKHWSADVPNGYSSPRLLYSVSTRTLIVELHSVGDEFLPARLFARRDDAALYTLVGNPPDDVSYESCVMSEDKPVIAFNALKWDRVRRSGNWSAVYVFNLQSQDFRDCVDRGSLPVPEPYVSGWVSRLVHLSKNATELYLCAGFKKPEQGRVDYWLSRLDLTTTKLCLITPLKDSFF